MKKNMAHILKFVYATILFLFLFFVASEVDFFFGDTSEVDGGK